MSADRDAAAPEAASAESGFAALWDGLSNPSAASMFGALAFAAVEILACTFGLTPRRVAALSPYTLMKSEADDYARVTVLALRLKLERPGALSVVYLGPSSAHRALLDSWDPRPIERALTAKIGEPVHFYSLYCAGQTLEESLLLVHQIPRGFRGVVTLVVYDDKDDVRAKSLALADNPRLEERLALDPPDDEPRRAFDGRLLPRTGNYFYDHLQFFGARREIFLHVAPPWRPSPRGGPKYRHPPRRGSEEAVYARYADHPMPLMNRHLPVLTKIIADVHALGVPMVLVEAPANPRFEALKGAARGDYLARVARYAEDEHVAYWDLNPEVHLRRDDFEDAVHLATISSRLRFEHAYIDHLVPVLRSLARPGAKSGADDGGRDGRDGRVDAVDRGDDGARDADDDAEAE
ncbi:MAG TPA: hypothetical protein VHB21_14575 [Minicystis sp.]|nr:hypothetical protein [Minicystis sp.]